MNSKSQSKLAENRKASVTILKKRMYQTIHSANHGKKAEFFEVSLQWRDIQVRENVEHRRWQTKKTFRL